MPTPQTKTSDEIANPPAKRFKDMTPEEKKEHRKQLSLAIAAKQAKKAQERREKEEKDAAEFEANRELWWLRVWSLALKINAMFPSAFPAHPLRESESWWFEDFYVNAEEEWFTCFSGDRVSKESLSLGAHTTSPENILDHLNRVLESYVEWKQEEERKRQAALELERTRKEAKAKLSDAELKALGLSR